MELHEWLRISLKAEAWYTWTADFWLVDNRSLLLCKFTQAIYKKSLVDSQQRSISIQAQKYRTLTTFSLGDSYVTAYLALPVTLGQDSGFHVKALPAGLEITRKDD